MDSFLPFPLDSSDLPRKDTSEEEINKYVARGIILNLANAVRLQVRDPKYQPMRLYCVHISMSTSCHVSTT